MSDEKDQKKEKWYPGKYLGRAVKRASVANKVDRLSSDSKSNSSYHEIEEEESERGQSFVELRPDADDFIAPPNTPANTPKYTATSTSTSANANAFSSPFKVRVRILEVKYSRFKDAKFSIRLDSVKVSNIQETQLPYERTFDLLNITSDIKIEIKGQSTIAPHFNNGMIYIPVTSCLTFFGGVLPTLSIWKEIYPLYDSTKRCDAQLQKRLFSGLTDMPGTALPKPRHSLGFAHIEVDLILPTPNALGLYLLPPPAQETPKVEVELLDSSETSLAFSHAVGVREVDRLRSLFTPPPLMAPFMGFPEVFVLVALVGGLCYGVSEYQVPLVVYGILLANGLMNHYGRTNTHVQVWTEPGALPYVVEEDGTVRVLPPAPTASPLPQSSVVQLLRLNSYLYNLLLKVVHEAEVGMNMFSFAEPRVSVIFYSVLLVLAIAGSMLTVFISLRGLLFVTLSIPILYWALFPVLVEQAAQLPNASLYLPMVQAVRKLGKLWAALRSRVPDELDRQHLFIAHANTTKDGSLLMLDAAQEYAATAGTK